MVAPNSTCVNSDILPQVMSFESASVGPKTPGWRGKRILWCRVRKMFAGDTSAVDSSPHLYVMLHGINATL